MSRPGILQEGRVRPAERAARTRRRRRRRRRRTRLRHALTAVMLGLIALLVFMVPGASGPGSTARLRGGAESARSTAAHGKATIAAVLKRPAGNPYGVAPAPEQVHPRLKGGLRSGLLFDVGSGRVLWERALARRLPIASLTKMMTALVVLAHARPAAPVLITREAVHFSGSGIGLLPLGKRVRLETLLYGLMLPSGNDAAIALAQHVAGTQARFIAMMNATAAAMGLTCTHFTTTSGIVDQGNRSCGSDLARLAHAVLTRPRLARIVATSDAVLPFPIKGGKLYLYNNNPLLRLGYPGADGVKTGYTVAAGSCLVATARRGRRWLGVVLLHSTDSPGQAMALLNAGFAALRARRV